MVFDDGVAHKSGWAPMYEVSVPAGSALLFPPGWLHETINTAPGCTAALTTQFRGIHFFCVHRCMHPWWGWRNGLAQGDIGAFLYRWVHSLHHKSFNPGPWSSLSMHPVEHVSAATVGLGL